MVLIAGTDEAGRGPVIGPMVMCGITIEEKDISKLEEIGVKDSKKLTPRKRKELFPKIKEVVKAHEIIIVEPKEIDEALNNPHMNLNWLEAVKIAMVLNALKPKKAIVDCPSNNKEAFHTYIGRFLKQEIKMQMEHDGERYLPVAAASILAKVTRDDIIEKLKKKYGDFGSGYPSDPKTKEYLAKNYKKHPELFRTSWASYKKVQNQAKLSDF